MAQALDELGNLDPDDPRQASQQIAAKLRTAIADRKLGPGERLPSQPELAARYGVARETVKRALDILRAERLIVSRQGSGAFVRTQMHRPVELRPYIESAFKQEQVRIDFAGLSGETLRDALAEVLDFVRDGKSEIKSIRIRILAADTNQPMAIPVLAEGAKDDPRLRKRLGRIVDRSTEAILDQVSELEELGMVDEARVEIRKFALTPMFKAYLINGQDCFFGFYPIAARPLSLSGEMLQIFDTLGKDVPLLHFAIDDGEQGSQFVNAVSQWFDSVWETIARSEGS